jgi:hypothetical protein
MRDLKTVFCAHFGADRAGAGYSEIKHFGIFSRLTRARESFAYYAISEQCPRLGFGDNGVNLIANKIKPSRVLFLRVHPKWFSLITGYQNSASASILGLSFQPNR